MGGLEATSATREPAAAAAGFTVDELAARTGMTVRTVRFYASEGLLPPPVRRGRIAYYDARHRMRLDLIRTLQDHGYTLAAIERVLARIPFDAAPAEYVVHGAVLAPWLPEQTEILDRHALDRRVGRRLDDDLLAYLVEVGAVERVPADDADDAADERFRTSSSVLGYALEVLELPVSAEFLSESTRIIETHASAVADGLNDVFARTIWGPYQRGELEHEQVVALLDRIRPLAIQGLVGAFTRAADQAARRRVEGE